MTTSLTELLKIDHPIIQAPMLGVATPKLVAAVSNYGGLGSLPLGASTAQQALQLIDATKQLTKKPFAVNLFCHPPAKQNSALEAKWLQSLAPLFNEFNSTPPSTLAAPYLSFLEQPEILELLLQQRPAAVSFHFGIPSSSWLSQLRQAGIVTLATATCVEEAIIIEQAGIDIVVAQGYEAGGHRGGFIEPNVSSQFTTATLIRLIATKVNLPIVAAGGIMDGSHIKAILALGCSAAQLGTAFILATESAADASYRQALTSDKANHTAVTSLISGRPARGLVNRLHTDICCSDLPDYPIAYDAIKQLSQLAKSHNNLDFSVHWAGVGAPLARQLTASEIMQQLIDELQDSKL